ncbi:2-hydroxymuconic semialdehyde dehydrogenase [Croceicoccus estronivorus]|uniref:2-hydroxymuconic semialdehyde dehydrogenase n=1 Tax=Croceicoccus estronivorus TaxID=1172626 RepID=UPI0008322498|nr:2-hydroxymuconic semialdehyde dehydrogenase [Croceicoccus estronivorus]OCC23732.1 2-hydroxymuconic semialdehyde dehydrogenase [Croceicoccus estronivorus]
MLSIINNFIAGEYVEGSRGNLFDKFSPIDGSLVCKVHESSRDDIDAAVAAARRGQAEWAAMAPAQRAAVLHRVADGIDRRAEDFVAAECRDTGKPHSLASHLDIPRGAANFRIFADLVGNVPTESFMTSTPGRDGALNYAVRVPKGVVGVISPWNLPFLLMTWKVGPALACGNAVIVKPSEETPTTTTMLGEVMNEAGVPKGVFNVVHGFGPDSAGEFLTTHPGVDAITFTGETRTGAAIMKACADGIRDVSFELGGKNPAIVFADCDIDKAIDGTVRSVFSNCGQVCLATERVYVERPIFEEFVARLAERAKALRIGIPSDDATAMGPLISKEHQAKVLGYYELAVQEGANVVCGGGIPQIGEAYREGSWVEPTIWTGVDHSHRIMREEVFGPCCAIMPFDSEEEVIALANDTEYGLACSIWTENLSRGHRVAARIDCGLTWVNCWFLRDLRTPFGGSKMSGIGREGGVHSLEFYTELRNVCVQL